MRLIDADELKKKKKHSQEFAENVVSVAEIDWMPTIDAVEVVRCVNCEHYRKDRRINCVFHLSSVKEDWFCSEGK